MADILEFPGGLAPAEPCDVEPETAETVAQRRLIDILEWLTCEARAGRLVWKPAAELEDENG